MTIKRRDLLKGAAAGTMAVVASPFVHTVARAAPPIRIGVVLDLTGPIGIFGVNKKRCYDLAADEVNSKGGLLGRQIEFVTYDAQANNQLYGQFAQQMVLRDKLDAVFGGMTSSSREIVRPIFNRGKLLYFYNMPYEGGVCDRNAFVTGTTPGQLLANLLPAAIKKFGKKIYYVGVDYNFGQISGKWAAKIAKENGAEVIGQEFHPIGANQFGPTISKIQAAKPDFVLTTLIASDAFYQQFAASGAKRSIGLASQTFGQVGEHFRLPKDVGDGIMICYNYVDEIDTPANKSFLDRFKKHFQGVDYGYLGDLAGNSYQGFWLYHDAVKMAGTTSRDKVIQALETGKIAIDGPSGRISVDPKTHHVNFNMFLWEVQNQTLKLVQKFDNVAPANPNNECDLQKNPNTNAQFEPKI